MKPFGREKKITGGNEWKIDRHPHPKHKIKNWWEDMCDCLSRSTIKFNWKKEIIDNDYFRCKTEELST